MHGFMPPWYLLVGWHREIVRPVGRWPCFPDVLYKLGQTNTRDGICFHHRINFLRKTTNFIITLLGKILVMKMLKQLLLFHANSSGTNATCLHGT